MKLKLHTPNCPTCGETPRGARGSIPCLIILDFMEDDGVTTEPNGEVSDHGLPTVTVIKDEVVLECYNDHSWHSLVLG